MLLSKALLKVGMTGWRKMARYYGLEHLEFSSNRLYQALLLNLRDISIIRDIFEQLPIAEAKLLSAVVLAQLNSFTFDYRHWKNYMLFNRSVDISPLQNLQERGLVYTDGQEKYIIPEETAAALLVCLQNEAEQIAYLTFEQRLSQTGGVIVLSDIMRIMDNVRKNDIRITQANTVYKRDQEQFDELFAVGRDNFNFNIGSRFDFVYKFVKQKGLVINEVGHLTLTQKGKQWFNQSASVLWQEVIKFWLNHYPVDAASRVAQPILLGMITELIKTDLGISQENFYQAYLKHGGIVPINTNGHDWWDNTINELVYLGLLRRSYSDDKLVLAVNDMGIKLWKNYDNTCWMCEEEFIVQPDFQILVSSHIKPYLLWELASIAEDEGGLDMYRYRLTRDSIYQALLAGASINQIFDFLRRGSKLAVPNNVIQTLVDWSDRFGRMFVMKTCILSCESNLIADEIMAISETSQYIRGRINDTMLLVDCEDYQALLQKIEDRNYMPYKQLFSPNNRPF